MNKRLVYLFHRYTDGIASDAEQEELMTLVSDSRLREQLMALLQETWSSQHAATAVLDRESQDAILTAIFKKGDAAPVVPITKQRTWWRYLAAASVLVAILAAAWLFTRKPSSKNIFPQDTAALPQDVTAPSTNKATITLSNGEKIYLDSARNGSLVREGNVQVVVRAGQVIYEGQSDKEIFNTLTNPRGSRVVTLTLADGSRVWLNSESSITYPVAFRGSGRKVEVSGEAYFEVAKKLREGSSERVPFTVMHGQMQVEVLGTHFNINAYQDDGAIKVTLLEGAVAVRNGAHDALLAPGQQAVVAENISIFNNADLDDVMAWKNGLFSFNKTGLREVMQTLSRWYNVEVQYEGAVPHREFWGKIRRNSNLSEVLLILEKSNIHCRLEGNKLLVLAP